MTAKSALRAESRLGAPDQTVAEVAVAADAQEIKETEIKDVPVAEREEEQL